jgi:hypothetical protein
VTGRLGWATPFDVKLRAIGRAGWIVRSGWLPATILAIATGVVLMAYGTAPRDIAIFGAYVAFGVAVPGMLWVRLARGHPAHISEDLTLGMTVGWCLEIGIYLVARALGRPELFLLWPALTWLAFASVPSLRRCWRGAGIRAPMWWSWSLAVVFAYVLAYSAAAFFGPHHLTGADTPYVDMPFHLALIGELRNHVPPAIPYVDGVPLAYHWFFYAEAAATSWATGIEPLTLLYRLAGLPMFVAFIVLTAATARRLSAGWWTGLLAVGIAVFGTVAEPYRWLDAPVYDTQTLALTWISPTNLFGLALFAASILTSLDLLAAKGRGSLGTWSLWVILAVGIAGAKATLAPLLVGGLVVMCVALAIQRRGPDRRAAAAVVVGGVVLALAAILLFRGSTGGLSIGLDSLRSLPIVAALGARGGTGLTRWAMAATGGLVAIALWSFLWAGMAGLLRGRGTRLSDASILLLLGICVAGLGAASLLSFPDLSQQYFVKDAVEALALLAAAGIAALVPGQDVRRAFGGAIALAAAIGAGAVVSARALEPAVAPTLAGSHLLGVIAAAILPVLFLVAVAAVCWGVLAWLAPMRSSLRLGTPLLLIAVLLGFGIPAAIGVFPRSVAQAKAIETISPDAIAAGRWLRDHSDPADLVATNLHCLYGPQLTSPCDARHFWVSAYTERHILVEGWAYTVPATQYRADHGLTRTLPFWDPPLLAANDAAFRAPSATNLALLRHSYGVRWLYADLTTADALDLGRLADLRDLAGSYAVYELRP